jgi:hypothetical protein
MITTKTEVRMEIPEREKESTFNQSTREGLGNEVSGVLGF